MIKFLLVAYDSISNRLIINFKKICNELKEKNMNITIIIEKFKKNSITNFCQLIDNNYVKYLLSININSLFRKFKQLFFIIR